MRLRRLSDVRLSLSLRARGTGAETQPLSLSLRLRLRGQKCSETESATLDVLSLTRLIVCRVPFFEVRVPFFEVMNKPPI